MASTLLQSLNPPVVDKAPGLALAPPPPVQDAPWWQVPQGQPDFWTIDFQEYRGVTPASQRKHIPTGWGPIHGSKWTAAVRPRQQAGPKLVMRPENNNMMLGVFQEAAMQGGTFDLQLPSIGANVGTYTLSGFKCEIQYVSLKDGSLKNAVLQGEEFSCAWMCTKGIPRQICHDFRREIEVQTDEHGPMTFIIPDTLRFGGVGYMGETPASAQLVTANGVMAARVHQFNDHMAEGYLIEGPSSRFHVDIEKNLPEMDANLLLMIVLGAMGMRLN